MKKLPYLIGALLCLGFVILLGNEYIAKNWRKEVKGEINILSTYENYDYLKECADKFIEENKKVKINIERVYDVEYIKKAQEALGGNVDIIQLDTISLNKLSHAIENYEINQDIVDTYKNNFTQARIQEADVMGEIKGVPLSSRPLLLYIREDMLNTYGYKYSDINTWEDILSIGEDIYTKSEGKVRLLNATGKDYEDLMSILIMQQLESGEKDKEVVVGKVNNFFNMLKEKNIINLKDGNEFVGRISSINGMRELSLLTVECNWIASYPPSSIAGGNKFYVGEGSNLIVLSNREDKTQNDLNSKFISYVSTNTDIAIKYAKTGAFFPSYLYTYKDKSIENHINNFSLRSPLVLMSNIVEKAPKIEDYELYKDIKSHFVTY